MGAPDHARARLGLARPHRALGAAGVRHLYRRHGGPTAPFSLSERHGAGCCGRVASWSCRAAAGRGGSRASRGRGRAGASGRAASRVLVCRLYCTMHVPHAPWSDVEVMYVRVRPVRCTLLREKCWFARRSLTTLTRHDRTTWHGCSVRRRSTGHRPRAATTGGLPRAPAPAHAPPHRPEGRRLSRRHPR